MAFRMGSACAKVRIRNRVCKTLTEESAMTDLSGLTSRGFSPWVFSLLLHACTLLLLVWFATAPIYPQEGLEVELVRFLPGSGGGSPRSSRQPAPGAPSSVVPSTPSPSVHPGEERSTVKGSPEVGEAHGIEENAGTVTRPVEGGEDLGGPKYGARTGIGAGSDGAGEAPGGRGYGWTQLLRQRIKGAQRYPELALRFGMEGTVEVEFEIARDGSVEWVRVTKSSGYPLLDEASVEAVKRAAPLPVVPGRIRIPISYRLRERG